MMSYVPDRDICYLRPDVIATIARECDDPEWLGRVIMGAVGKDIELDYGQKQMVNVIKSECAKARENADKRRAKWRARKRKERSKASDREGDDD